MSHTFIMFSIDSNPSFETSNLDFVSVFLKKKYVHTFAYYSFYSLNIIQAVNARVHFPLAILAAKVAKFSFGAWWLTTSVNWGL